jgi:processive 1,2-diacylglycerol beta-glucosyltransferase
MHFSNVTGHHRASLAIEKALREIDGNVRTQNIDALYYTNAFLGRRIYKLYLFVIKRLPRVWDYLYDNNGVLEKLKKLRALVHKLNDKKIKKLLNEFSPELIVCTQAFPCGLIADFKSRHRLKIPLVAVLTDYVAHSYWLNDFVDMYIVPTSLIEKKLKARGIPGRRIKILGIPIDPKFRQNNNGRADLQQLGLEPHLPTIMVMGGNEGLGPMEKTVQALDELNRPLQLIVVCGRNKKLYRKLRKNRNDFRKPVSIMAYSNRIDDLMAMSTLIVGKPGGLTSAEALSKSLPLIIVNPLPGQESRNTQFLLEAGVALKTNSLPELKNLIEKLLGDNIRLDNLRRKARSFAQPDSALRISQFILTKIQDEHVVSSV